MEKIYLFFFSVFNSLLLKGLEICRSRNLGIFLLPSYFFLFFFFFFLPFVWSVNMATPQRSPPCRAPGCSIQSPHGGWAEHRNTAAGAATPALPTGIELQRFGKGTWREGAQTQAEALTHLTSNSKSRATLSAKQVPLSPSLRIWPF